MKRVTVIAVAVLVIVGCVEAGLSQDAATQRSLKAAEFDLSRSSTDALVCQHLTALDQKATARLFLPVNGGGVILWGFELDLDTLRSDAAALGAVGQQDIATKVNPLTTDDLSAWMSHLKWKEAKRTLKADLRALLPSVCSGGSSVS